MTLPPKLLFIIRTLCFVGLCGVPQCVRAQTLHTLDAIYQSARLLDISRTNQWTLSVNQQSRSMATDELVRWGGWPGVLEKSAVWLSDGSLLCGAVDLGSEGVTITHDWLQVPELPYESIRGLVLAPPATLNNWLVLYGQMQAIQGDQDVVWLSGGRKMNGILRVTSDKKSGQLVIELDTAGQSLPLTIDQIEAIVFSPTLLGPIPTHRDATALSLVDGSQLWTTQVTPNASSVELKLENAIVLQSFDPASSFANAVVGIARPAAHTQFLSDLTPASYRHLPDSTLAWELGVDRDVRNLPLHAGQKIFQRGLATHSSSQVAFRWDGSAARFLAEAQLADPPPQAAKRLGSVRCQVLLARDRKLQTVHEFNLQRTPDGAQKNGAPPSSELISVDLVGAELVVLVTDKSDFGQYGDHLLWLDARISRP